MRTPVTFHRQLIAFGPFPPGAHCLGLTCSRADRSSAMGFVLKQTRGGCMLVPTRSAAQRRKAKEEARSFLRAMARRCKCWHGEAAEVYHEELTRNKQLKESNSFGVGDSIVPHNQLMPADFFTSSGWGEVPANVSIPRQQPALESWLGQCRHLHPERRWLPRQRQRHVQQCGGVCRCPSCPEMS